MKDLLPKELLPNEFEYPTQFTRIVDQGLIDLRPWAILLGNGLRDRANGLRIRYPNRRLIPFARRWDNDDVACWENGDTETVIVVHDFSTPGSESRQKYPSFWDWLRAAIEDTIDHDP